MATISNTAVTVGNTTTAVLAVPTTKRISSILSNDSIQVMYLAIGANAVLNQGIRLAPGEKFLLERIDEENATVNAICANGSANLCVYDETY